MVLGYIFLLRILGCNGGFWIIIFLVFQLPYFGKQPEIYSYVALALHVTVFVSHRDMFDTSNVFSLVPLSGTSVNKLAGFSINLLFLSSITS